jgi:hypothetical protein
MRGSGGAARSLVLLRVGWGLVRRLERWGVSRVVVMIGKGERSTRFLGEEDTAVAFLVGGG